MAAVTINGYAYEAKADHRNSSPNKSQWTIPLPSERDSFELAVTNGWIVNDRCWSLHEVGGKPQNLGTSAVNEGPVIDLFIAVFQLAATCHGYPTDPRRSSHDRPPTSVQKSWLEQKRLRPALIRKIGRGGKCSL